jgi:hypothetical protein
MSNEKKQSKKWVQMGARNIPTTHFGMLFKGKKYQLPEHFAGYLVDRLKAASPTSPGKDGEPDDPPPAA